MARRRRPSAPAESVPPTYQQRDTDVGSGSDSGPGPMWRVADGRSVTDGAGTHGPGSQIRVPIEEARRLQAAGFLVPAE